MQLLATVSLPAEDQRDSPYALARRLFATPETDVGLPLLRHPQKESHRKTQRPVFYGGRGSTENASTSKTLLPLNDLGQKLDQKCRGLLVRRFFNCMGRDSSGLEKHKIRKDGRGDAR